MSVITWFLLSCKRQMKHKFFVVLLFLVPAALFGFSRIEQQDSGKIRIGVYGGDEDLVPGILRSLEEQDGMFEFYRCDSEQGLKDDVAARRAECGFVFTERLKEKLDERKIKRLIEVYSAPSTIMNQLAKEVVFASVIEVYGKSLLRQFADESEIFAEMDNEQLWAELEEAYAAQGRDGKTFSFRYETLSTQAIETGTARIAFPVRGMLAIFLMVIGIFSAVSVRRDEQSGLFLALPYGAGLPCKVAVLAAPVCLSGISALITLAVTGNLGNAVTEMTLLLIYLVMIVIFAFVMRAVVKDPVLLCGLIPVLILASLVVCPVFFDFSQWLPGLHVFRYFLPPYYYILMAG